VVARRFQLGSDRGGEAHIAGQAEQVIDPIQLAPAHQLFTGKSRNRHATGSAAAASARWCANKSST